jgi:hypothetical protein
LPNPEIADGCPDLVDHPDTLHAENERHTGTWITSGAVVDVREVQADCGVANPDLLGSGTADIDRFEAKFLRPAVPVNAYCSRFRH